MDTREITDNWLRSDMGSSSHPDFIWAISIWIWRRIAVFEWSWFDHLFVAVVVLIYVDILNYAFESGISPYL